MKVIFDSFQLLANIATCIGVAGVWVAYKQFRVAAQLRYHKGFLQSSYFD